MQRTGKYYMEKKDQIRKSMEYVKKELGDTSLRVAEIGIRNGANAVRLLSLNVEKLYLIDPYLPYGDIKDNQQDQDSTKAGMIKRINKHPKKDKVEFIFKPSIEAAKHIPDNSLDYVYIDGDHSYKAVKEDLDAWYPKVKKGRFLGGHDRHRVEKAIREFGGKHKLRLIIWLHEYLNFSLDDLRIKGVKDKHFREMFNDFLFQKGV